MLIRFINRLGFLFMWLIGIPSILRFHWALWTRRVPRKWLKVHDRIIEEMAKIKGKLEEESGWSFIRRTVDPKYIDFVYQAHMSTYVLSVYECPIMDNLESELDLLRRDEIPSPRFLGQALRQARTIRHDYAKLLARGVGGPEYATMWKRNIAALDRIIETHTISA